VPDAAGVVHRLVEARHTIRQASSCEPVAAPPRASRARRAPWSCSDCASVVMPGAMLAVAGLAACLALLAGPALRRRA
jgi:ribosomal protein L37AE/L43A